jgi:hypothetical protein
VSMVEMDLGLSRIVVYWLPDDTDMETSAHSCSLCASFGRFAFSIEVLSVRLDLWEGGRL